MKKINAIINSFAFLLLAVLMSACNKDGIETIVIEDGQPSVAQMIIGTWNPDRGEIVDEERHGRIDHQRWRRDRD